MSAGGNSFIEAEATQAEGRASRSKTNLDAGEKASIDTEPAPVARQPRRSRARQ